MAWPGEAAVAREEKRKKEKREADLTDAHSGRVDQSGITDGSRTRFARSHWLVVGSDVVVRQ